MSSNVSIRFVWITSDQRHMTPEVMATSHLFNIVKMIWNHTASEPDRIYPYIRWRLGPRFTPEYCRQAVTQCMVELSKRDDVTDYMERSLAFMASRINKPTKTSALPHKNRHLPNRSR